VALPAAGTRPREGPGAPGSSPSNAGCRGGTEEAWLIQLAQCGDPDAFEALVRRHRLRVYRIALRILADPVESEDAAQDAFVQAWQALGRFRGDAAFSTWMYRVVTNRCLNRLRDRRRSDPLSEAETLPAVGMDTADSAVARVEIEAVKRAIDNLTPEQRAPWVLREFEGLTYEQIADALDLSLSAVKARIHRARQEIFHKLRGWHEPDEGGLT
jgi:RNA polymerase sigma-70 factor (ECF subfamily)